MIWSSEVCSSEFFRIVHLPMVATNYFQKYSLESEIIFYMVLDEFCDRVKFIEKILKVVIETLLYFPRIRQLKSN